MTSPRPRTRRLRAATGLAVAGLAAALTLTGCSATNPMTTEKEYNSSDGVGAHVGDIKAINFLIASEAKGEPGALLGALENKGSDDADGDDHARRRRPDRQGARRRRPSCSAPPAATPTRTRTIVFESIPEPPGAVVPVTVATKDAGSVTLDVPIVDGTLPEYADSLPSPTS